MPVFTHRIRQPARAVAQANPDGSSLMTIAGSSVGARSPKAAALRKSRTLPHFTVSRTRRSIVGPKALEAAGDRAEGKSPSRLEVLLGSSQEGLLSSEPPPGDTTVADADSAYSDILSKGGPLPSKSEQVKASTVLEHDYIADIRRIIDNLPGTIPSPPAEFLESFDTLDKLLNMAKHQFLGLREQCETSRRAFVHQTECNAKAMELVKKQHATEIDEHRQKCIEYERTILRREEMMLTMPSDSTTQSLRLVQDNERLVAYINVLRCDLQKVTHEFDVASAERVRLQRERSEMKAKFIVGASMGHSSTLMEKVSHCLNAVWDAASANMASTHNRARLLRAYRTWSTHVQTISLRRAMKALELQCKSDSKALVSHYEEKVAMYEAKVVELEKEVYERDRRLQVVQATSGMVVIDRRPVIGTKLLSLEELHDSIVSLYRVVLQSLEQIKVELRLKTFVVRPFSIMGTTPLPILIFSWIESHFIALSLYLTAESKRRALAVEVSFHCIRENIGRERMRKKVEMLSNVSAGLLRNLLAKKMERLDTCVYRLNKLRLLIKQQKNTLIKQFADPEAMTATIQESRNMFDQHKRLTLNDEMLEFASAMAVTRKLLTNERNGILPPHSLPYRSLSPVVNLSVVTSTRSTDQSLELLQQHAHKSRPTFLIGSVIAQSQPCPTDVHLDLHSQPHQRLPMPNTSLRTSSSTMKMQSQSVREAEHYMMKERVLTLTAPSGQLLPLRSTLKRPVTVVPASFLTPVQELGRYAEQNMSKVRPKTQQTTRAKSTT